MTFSRLLLPLTLFLAVLSLPEIAGRDEPEPAGVQPAYGTHAALDLRPHAAEPRWPETADAKETQLRRPNNRAVESRSWPTWWPLAALLTLPGFWAGVREVIKHRRTAKGLHRRQAVTRELREAMRLMRDNQLEAALDRFNTLVAGAPDGGDEENGLPGEHAGLETACENREILQDKIFNRLVADIDKSAMEAANAGSSGWAETLCFQLERLQSKFDEAYRRKTRTYLQERAPEILNQVWAFRAHRFKGLSHPSDIGEAVQTCIHYIIAHRSSEFMPLKLVETQFSRLVSRWARVHLRPGGEPGACQSFLNAEKLRGLSEQEELSPTIVSGLEAACEKLRVACQVEQIHTTGDAGARLDALNMLNDLYEPLQTCARDRMLQRRILDCFDHILVVPDEQPLPAQEDAYFYRIICEIQEKLLRKLVDAASKLSDHKMASTYRRRLERLTAARRTQGAATGSR